MGDFNQPEWSPCVFTNKWNKILCPHTQHSWVAVRASEVPRFCVFDCVDDGASAGRVAGCPADLGQAAQRQRQGGTQEPQGEVRISDIQGDPAPCSKPPIDIDVKFVFEYKVLILKRIFKSMSTGGFEQAEWSPCTLKRFYKGHSDFFLATDLQLDVLISCPLYWVYSNQYHVTIITWWLSRTQMQSLQ